MRGKLHFVRMVCHNIRITPAHAGKTRDTDGLTAENRDHPRACGENSAEGFEQKLPLGSPPRMRGKHTPELKNTPNGRITPAHAGKTIDNRRISIEYKDHPRACGENASI